MLFPSVSKCVVLPNHTHPSFSRSLLRAVAVTMALGGFLAGVSTAASAQVAYGGGGPGGGNPMDPLLVSVDETNGTGVRNGSNWSYSFSGSLTLLPVANTSTTWNPAYRTVGTDPNNPNSNKPLQIRVSMGANAPGSGGSGYSTVSVRAYVVHKVDQTFVTTEQGFANWETIPSSVLTKYYEGQSFTGANGVSQFKLEATGGTGGSVLAASAGF